MNSRDRKGGGKGGPRGPGRGRDRDEKRPPSRIVNLPPTVVDRGAGWIIQKIGRVDQNSHAAAGAQYNLIFDGHDPLVFDYLSAARDRSKEPPPEKAEVSEEVAADPTPEPDADPAAEAGDAAAAAESAPDEATSAEPPATQP